MICLDHYYSLFLSPFLKIGTMIESFHLPGNFSLFQIELISLWSQSELFYPYFNQFCWDLINTWWFVLFGFSVSISTSKALSSGTSGSTLPNIINPHAHSKAARNDYFFSQNTVGVCNQITLLVLYHISSRVLTLLKVTDACMQVSDIFYLTVSFKFINFSFQTFLLFLKCLLTSHLT